VIEKQSLLPIQVFTTSFVFTSERNSIFIKMGPTLYYELFRMKLKINTFIHRRTTANEAGILYIY
jgi:hypothetical protein